MKQTRVLVLGGGLAGLAAAFTIQKTLRRRNSVTLVAASPLSVLRQALPRVAFGLKREEKNSVDIAGALSSKGIGFKKAMVLAIDEANSKISTDSGHMAYDYLVLALGAKWDWKGTPGSENALSLGSMEGALRARDAISSFCGGGVCSIAAEGNKWEGPALETIFHARAFLNTSGIRKESSLHYVTAKKRPFEELGSSVSGEVEKQLEGRGIELHPNCKATAITKNSVELSDGTLIESSLSFLYPGYYGNDLIAGQVFADGRNFILVDQHMRAKGTHNIFAAGDCVNSLSLKMGFNALSGATVAGENIARELIGKPLVKFSPKIVYVMELGDGEGLLVRASHKNGRWNARTSKGGLQYLRKLSFEKSFLEQSGIVGYALGEKLGG